MPWLNLNTASWHNGFKSQDKSCSTLLQLTISLVTALGKKLFHSLLVRVFKVQYLFPDGRGTTRGCPGWVLSTLMDLAFLRRRSAYTQSRVGSAAFTILWAVFTTRVRSLLFHNKPTNSCTEGWWYGQRFLFLSSLGINHNCSNLFSWEV